MVDRTGIGSGDGPGRILIRTFQRVSEAASDQRGDVSNSPADTRRRARRRSPEVHRDGCPVGRVVERVHARAAVDRASHGRTACHVKRISLHAAGEIFDVAERDRRYLLRMVLQQVVSGLPGGLRQLNRRASGGEAELDRTRTDELHVICGAARETAIVWRQVAEVRDLLSIVQTMLQCEFDKAGGVYNRCSIQRRSGARSGHHRTGVRAGNAPDVAFGGSVKRVDAGTAHDGIDVVIACSHGDGHAAAQLGIVERVDAVRPTVHEIDGRRRRGVLECVGQIATDQPPHAREVNRRRGVAVHGAAVCACDRPEVAGAIAAEQSIDSGTASHMDRRRPGGGVQGEA